MNAGTQTKTGRGQALGENKPFVINSCRVCLNPIVLGYVCEGYHENYIEVAELEGKWYTGYVFTSDNYADGGAAPCMITSRGGFDTMEEAVLALCHKLAEYYKNRPHYSNLMRALRKAEDEIQPTLF